MGRHIYKATLKGGIHGYPAGTTVTVDAEHTPLKGPWEVTFPDGERRKVHPNNLEAYEDM